MERAYQDVREFMQIAGQECPEEVTLPAPDSAEWHLLDRVSTICKDEAENIKESGNKSLHALRARLMLEELGETLQGMLRGDPVETADGLADLCYVVIGTAVAYGIPLPGVFEEVQRANISKFEFCQECAGSSIEEAVSALFPREEGEQFRSVAKAIRLAVMQHGDDPYRTHAFVTSVEHADGRRPFENLTVPQVRMMLGRYLDGRIDHCTGKIRFGRADCSCGGSGRIAVKDAQGKVTKPTNWQPPDIAGVLARQRSS